MPPLDKDAGAVSSSESTSSTTTTRPVTEAINDGEKKQARDTNSDINEEDEDGLDDNDNDDDRDTDDVEAGHAQRTAPPSKEGNGNEMPTGVLARVISRVSSRSKHFDPGPPPDGGWEAWIACACTHLVIMDTWGVINSFGSFQTYYTQLLDKSPSQIAWIGSFQIFLLFFVGTFTGRLTDAGYFRQLLALGTILQLVGIFTTAQATQYWQIFLSQGVCMGLGNGCLFCPSLATLSTYFSKKRSFAIGIAAVGSASGGLVFPSIVRQLLPKVGFPWTMRVLGFVQLATLLAVNAGLRQRLPPRRSGRIIEWQAFKEPQYAFYAAGSFFCFWSVYIVFFYIASYSRDIIGMPYTDSLNLLLLINGVGFIGRTVPNYLADRFGVINMFIICGFYAGIAAMCWTAVKSTVGLYVWVVFYGIAAGAIQSLFPAGLTSLNTKDLSKAGVRMGMIFTLNSLATLTGPPIAGALVSADGGRYLGAQMFIGSVLLIGSCFLICAKVALGRETGKGWRARV